MRTTSKTSVTMSDAPAFESWLSQEKKTKERA